MLSRFGLVVWLTLPFVLVGSLWFAVDRDRAMPASEPGPATAPAAEAGDMVQPESLPQGFIVVVEDRAKRASASDPIYMPSSHNGWNPGDEGAKLTPRSDMRWQIVFEKPTLDSRIAFKFARGTWDKVETNADFSDIENRMLPLVDASKLKPGEKPILEFTVEQWRDAGSGASAQPEFTRYRPITVAGGRIARVEVSGGGVPAMRDLLVWLPPGYDDPANAERYYPVLYMQDGQNIFEAPPGVPGEWRADETATRLIAENKIEPLIIVGIPSLPATRLAEYSPVQMIDGVPPRGDWYAAFVIDEVKPRIDHPFRTMPDPQNTAIGGSSMGGLIALHIGSRRPDVFGKVLAESPTLLIGDRAPFRHLANARRFPERVYFGMGGKEAGDDAADQGKNRQYVAVSQAFQELLNGKQVPEQNRKFVVAPDAAHNEDAWAERLPVALEFLFPPRSTP